ncbi:hypothetical protein IWQ61_002671 [Dispira simplex]|nr:hypothetical protein IWQ61_002671 [Dispira simplex]
MNSHEHTMGQSMASEAMGSSPTTDPSSELKDPQSELRARIRAIMNDPTVSAQEKPHLIQSLLSPSINQSTSSAEPFQGSPSSEIDVNQEARYHALLEELPDNVSLYQRDLVPTFHEEKKLGCSHYQRGAKMYTGCCKKWYTCRFCHNDHEDHTLDRFSVKYMMCMYCQKVQPAGPRCINPMCDHELGAYYCDVCHFWSNDISVKIFHCADCKLCRVGLEEDYRHCPTCNCCITKSAWSDHRCLENKLDVDCPICGDYLFTSKQHMTFMKCGHAIHMVCLEEYLNTSYQCPICRKSLGNVDVYFSQLDRVLEEQLMPSEYQNTRARIFCNDCEKRSVTKYHFLYHKCQECGSYSTKVLSTFTEPTEESSQS